jgi:hypothetical protein
MKNKIYASVVLAIAMMSGGCSAVMPYKSEFSCEKGKGEGICDSVSNTYKMVNDSKKTQSTKENPQEQSEIYYKQSGLNFEHCYDEMKDHFCVSKSTTCFQAKKTLFEECIEQTKQNYFLSHKDSIATINKLMAYQHLENERLRQKLELEFGVNHEK